MNDVITYSELLKDIGKNPLTYNELLSTKEWQDRRLEIISRDQGHCSNCRKYATINEYMPNIRKTIHLWHFQEYERDSKDNFVDILSPQFKGSDKPYYMQVHQKFYVLGKLPWDYEDEALITLCNWCH